MNKMKGAWVHWIYATVILFVLIVMFEILTYPMQEIMTNFDNRSFQTEGINASWHTTIGRIETTWNWWPIVAAGAIILMIFYISTREEYDTGYVDRR